MSDEEFVEPILPVVSDAPRPPEKPDDIPAPRPGPQKPLMITPAPPMRTHMEDTPIRRVEPVRMPDPQMPPPRLPPEPPPAAYHGDPWAKVPLDLYWFTRTWSRSPYPDEYREWEFELVTIDNKRQQGRMLSRIDGPFELALVKAKAGWAEQLPPNMYASKIMVLSS